MVLISEPAASVTSPKEKSVVVQDNATKEPVVTITPLESIEPPFATIPERLKNYSHTHKQLFTTVDSEKCSPEIYAETLKIYVNSLFYGLHSYRPASQTSRQRVQSGKVKWRNREKAVSKAEQDFVIKISDELNLDELQSYDLFFSYLHEASLDESASFQFDEDGLQMIKDAYYSERLYLLQAIISVLRNTMAEEHAFHKESSAVMRVLIAQGLDDELMNQFVELADNTPLHMKNESGAIQMLEEMTTLLCGLFLLYYHEAPQSADKLLYVLRVFKETGFGERVFASEYIHNVQIQNSIAYLKNMSVLVSLVVMQLEDLLYEDKLSSHPFIERSDEISSEIMNSNDNSNEWGRVDAHAPVMLAWCLWDIAAKGGLGDLEFKWLDKILVNLSPIPYLIDMLKNGLDKDDIAINGYKSVVKGLVSAILVLFPEESPLWATVPVFDLYCLTNENSPPLAALFWEAEITHPVLGGWVRQATTKFPMESAPLLQVMKALSSDSESANHAFSYIEKLQKYTVRLSEGEDLQRRVFILQNTDETVVAIARSQVRFNSVVVPENTQGEIVSNEIISWDLPFDGWQGIISAIGELAKDLRIKLNEKDDRYQTALASLKLISNLMSFDDELVHRFYSAYDGMLPKILPTFLLECLHYGQPLPLSASALNCIYYFAKTCSATQMWRKLNPTLFHTLRYTIDEQEPSAMTYPVTLGILDLTDCVLHSTSQTARSELYNETTVPLQLVELEDAMRFCNAVFSNFSTWVYNVVREKWIIGSRAMDIFHKVLTDYAPIPNSNENENNARVHKSVLLYVLVNKDVQRNLFSIISLGVETIENSQKHKEMLETFVLLSLALVDVALAMLPSEQVTTLQNALFEGNTLDSIAGFSRYKTNPDISVRALRILTHASRTGVALSTVLRDQLRLRSAWLSALSHSHSLLTSSSQPTLCFHILAFFCSILKHQPTLIINICGKKLPEFALENNNNSVARHEEANSLSKIIFHLFTNKIMDTNPQVCSELCHLIFLLWTRAPNLDTTLELKASKPFWDYLVEIVTSHQAESAYNTSARAWVLLTISLELNSPKHIAQSNFATIANSKTQLLWVANYIPTFLREHLTACEPNKGFVSVPQIVSNFDLDTVYGDRYFYDATRLERNSAPEGLLAKVKSANLCLSLAHSHSLFLKAWSVFLYAAHECHSVWFAEVPAMVAAISEKLNIVLTNEIDHSSIFDGVAPLFLAVCKLLPHPVKIDALSLSKIFTDIANVFAQHTKTNPESLSHICTAVVQLIRKIEMPTTFWRDADLMQANENLVDACWSLIEVIPLHSLQDSIFSLLGSILKVTELPTLILNNTKQPSLMTLMSVLARTLQKEENAQHAENLVNLIHQLASHTDSAAALLLDGLLNVLCNKNSPFFSNFSQRVYDAKMKRNSWHLVWCACVRVVTQLVRTLKFTEDSARRAMEFVNTHADRLWGSINLQHKELRVGVLEELETTVQLIKELAVYTNRWKYAPPDFANAWGNSIVRLSHYLVLLFSSESGLKQRLVDSNADEDGKAEDYKEELLLRTLVSCFYILQLSGPQITKFLAAQDNPSSLAAEIASVTYIFAPTFEFGPNSIPNLSIPIYAIHHSFAALRSMTTSLSSSAPIYPNKFHSRLATPLLSVIELSLSLFLSHLFFFLHKLDLQTHPDMVQQLHGSGTEMVYQIINYLEDLVNVYSDKELMVIRQINSYLASLLRIPINN